MAARDIGSITDPEKIVPKIKETMLPRSHTASDMEHSSDYDGHTITKTGLVKRSIDYTMFLATASLGIIVLALLLQGFKPYGFHVESDVLATLMPSLSAAAGLNALGWIAGKILGK